VIQEPGDSGESSESFARIKIEQSQNPRYGARGVARRPLSQGEAIVRLSGALTKQSYRTIQIDKYRRLEEPRILAFLNHSCHPTVLVDTSCLMVFAARDIVAGEELAFFNPSTEWKMVRPFVCLCGSARCLHYIAGARHLSLYTLDRHFINSHIRDLAMASLDDKPNQPFSEESSSVRGGRTVISMKKVEAMFITSRAGHGQGIAEPALRPGHRDVSG
jgi:hypothetical protein